MRIFRSIRRGAGFLAAVLSLTAAPSAAAADRLPDLGMARLSDLRIERSDSRRLLRYTTVIVNVGSGPFEVLGRRSSNADPSMSEVKQRIYDDANGVREVPTDPPATMVFGGDGHNHWHVRDLETSRLIRSDNGVLVGTGAKRGFCFFDNSPYRLTLAGAPANPVYGGVGCGGSSSLDVTMGLSIGWGDAYYSTLPDQYVDITGLVAGRYRLHVTADESAQFKETVRSNNATWVDLQLKGSGQVKILGYGPSA